MKIVSIDPYETRNGEARHKIFFEDEPDTPLILGETVSFKVGDEIDRINLELRQSGSNFYYVWKRQQHNRKETPSEKDISIRAQVAVKAVVDLTVAGKLDELLNPQNYLARATHDWIVAALIHDNVLTADALKPKQEKKKEG